MVSVTQLVPRPNQVDRQVPKDFLDTNDFSAAELRSMLDLVRLLKDADAIGCVPELLPRRSLGMIFEEPSTRTRVSFEVAIAKLGGHGLYLKPGEIHLGVRETVGDTARVLSRMCDVIEARVLRHETVVELAQYSRVPVINGLSDYNHPTQALCDVFTMSEHLPPGKSLTDCKVVFVGDRTNTCSSLMQITTKLGMHFVHAGPSKYLSPPEWLQSARANIAAAGCGSVAVTEDVEDAVADADFLYTDLWWWVDQEEEIPERKAAFMPRYQVDEALFSRAAGALFMHCLPASRGVEVTDGVIDSERSIAFEQAQNRLYTEMALLTWFVFPRLPIEPTSELRVHHEARLRDFLAGALDLPPHVAP
jgi:putrescine carbamoyltransferase